MMRVDAVVSAPLGLILVGSRPQPPRAARRGGHPRDSEAEVEATLDLEPETRAAPTLAGRALAVAGRWWAASASRATRPSGDASSAVDGVSEFCLQHIPHRPRLYVVVKRVKRVLVQAGDGVSEFYLQRRPLRVVNLAVVLCHNLLLGIAPNFPCRLVWQSRSDSGSFAASVHESNALWRPPARFRGRG